LIFYIRDEFEYVFGVGTYIPVTRVLKSRRTSLIPKPNQSGEYPSKLVWFGRVPAGMSFVVTSIISALKIENFDIFKE